MGADSVDSIIHAHDFFYCPYHTSGNFGEYLFEIHCGYKTRPADGQSLLLRPVSGDLSLTLPRFNTLEILV